MGLLDRLIQGVRARATATRSELGRDQKDAQQLLEEAMALEKDGRLDAALRCYDAAILLMPDLARAHFNRGNILLDRGDAAGALASYEKAVEFKPDSAAAHYNMGNAYLRLENVAAGVAACRRAIALKPDFADAHMTLGVALELQDKSSEAVTHYRRVVELRPDDSTAHSNLGDALRTLGCPLEAIDSYRKALQLDPHRTRVHSSLLFALNFVPKYSDHLLLAEALSYGANIAKLAGEPADFRNTPEPGRRLRIGFLSPDFRSHPVGYFIEAVLSAVAMTAKEGLEIFGYANFPNEDTVTKRIQHHCNVWRLVAALSDEHLAQKIREDRIDILIDLSGHTELNRLSVFAWKPAPVQVSWLGYFATTGVAAIDYLVADPWTLPIAEESYFTEKIWRLPETRLCFTAPDMDLPVNSLPALGNGYLTFASFHYLAKVNDSVVAVWARVLDAVPNSRLFIMAPQLNEPSERQKIIARFATCGLAADRLLIQPSLPRHQYLACYHTIDMVLDAFPYTGGTTTVEALWMGVPVLTLAGKSFLSRQGVGLLMNAGLPDWIAADPDDYVARAVAHAGDLQALAALRAGLRQQVLASPIFDAPRFARHFEAALRGMWQAWCAQNAETSTLNQIPTILQ